jgi:hypothetical protein
MEKNVAATADSYSLAGIDSQVIEQSNYIAGGGLERTSDRP